MSILSKLICRFNAVLMKLSQFLLHLQAKQFKIIKEI